MSLPEASPAEKHPRLTAIARRSRGVLRRINAAPRWLLWMKAGLLLLGLLSGALYLLPHIQPLALSRELVVGTRATPTSFNRENTNDESGKAIILETGFDHDLATAFAQSLGKKVRFVVANDEQSLHQLLERGEIHMAAAWLTKRFVEAPSKRHLTGADDEQKPQASLLIASRPYANDALVLVQPANTIPITRLTQLHDQEVHTLQANSYELWLANLSRQRIIPRLETHPNWTENDLLKAVGKNQVNLAIVPGAAFRIAINYTEGIDSTLDVGPEEEIIWAFPKRHGETLALQANQFLNTAEKDGTLRQLRDRYFGAVNRLQEADRSGFLAKVKTRLPQYLSQFKRAQATSGYDWRLLAALAYQESKWDANAVSKTGVRGLMMLTGDTADRLGVRNRLDPYESIMGGARYMDYLRDELPSSVPEPDRTWMAIASYNVGPNQINAARRGTKAMGLNPDSWADVKKALPQLVQTKDGTKIRGGEAVVTAENVRMYYAILSRLYPSSTGMSLSAPTRTYGISTPAKASSSLR
ncbi:MAG: transglycosylase SLT domain-containing protein [Fluviibacter sp.]